MNKIKFILAGMAITAMMINVSCNKDEGDPAAPDKTGGSVVVNELMSKDTLGLVYVDVQGDEADWCELYNPGDEDIDIAGYYIGDDGASTADIDKYEIPSTNAKATTIPSKGYLIIVWGAADASGNDMEGIFNDTLFVGSALKNSKDVAVTLWDTNNKLVDESGDFSEGGPLGADGLAKGKSYGRKTDGSSEWVVFDVATPGTENK